MAGKISKSVAAARKSLDKVVAKQKRKRALKKAGPVLKTAGAAAAIVGVLAGAAYGAKSLFKKSTEKKKVAARKKKAIAATATAVGATAIAARVRRGKAK